MRKEIVEAEVSLDRVVNIPEIWPEIFKYHSEDVKDYLNKLLHSPNALILGRKTFEFFAQVWPERKEEMADRINSMPKYVASRTLDKPLDWNATLIQDNVADGIHNLKQGNGADQYYFPAGSQYEKQEDGHL